MGIWRKGERNFSFRMQLGVFSKENIFATVIYPVVEYFIPLLYEYLLVVDTLPFCWKPS